MDITKLKSTTLWHELNDQNGSVWVRLDKPMVIVWPEATISLKKGAIVKIFRRLDRAVLCLRGDVWLDEEELTSAKFTHLTEADVEQIVRRSQE